MDIITQVSLKSILLTENGTLAPDVKGTNGFSATLIYPAAGISALTSVRTFENEIADREVLDFTQRPFKEKILFKQIFQGDSMLEVEITTVDKASKFEKVLLAFLGKAAIAGVGSVSGLGAIFTAVATHATRSVFSLPQVKDRVEVLGRGAMPINSKTPEGDFVIQLDVPEDLTLHQLAKNDEGKLVDRTLNLKKGRGIGQIVFNIKQIHSQSKLLA